VPLKLPTIGMSVALGGERRGDGRPEVAGRRQLGEELAGARPEEDQVDLAVAVDVAFDRHVDAAGAERRARRGLVKLAMNHGADSPRSGGETAWVAMTAPM